MRYLNLILLLVLGAYILTGVTEVRPGERAVVRRFGRVIATPGPGLWVGFPWGVDRIDRVAIDQVRRVAVGYESEEDDRTQNVPAGQLLTGDHNLVNVQVLVHYSVDDTRAVLFVINQNRVEDLISRATETVMAEWIAGRGIDEVLIEGKSVLPGIIINATQRRLEPYLLGVQIRDVGIAYLYPPEEVRQAFDDVTRAQTSILTRRHEALQEKAIMLSEAETDKFRIETATEAYVNDQLRLARAEAQRFELRLEQYRRLKKDNPNYLAVIWWEEVGQLFAQMKANGKLDFLDNHVGKNGLDITVFSPLPSKK